MAQQLFFINNFLDKIHEIGNISPNDKYESGPNLPCEKGKRTVLVLILTVDENAHYISFINLTLVMVCSDYFCTFVNDVASNCP